MNTSAIVYSLKDKEIISDGDEATISMENSTTLQNQFLHGCLKAKCTNDAVLTVCDMIVAVQGNPQMNALGEEMKAMLEGKYCLCVCSYVHVRTCVQEGDTRMLFHFHVTVCLFQNHALFRRESRECGAINWSHIGHMI